MTDIKKYNSLMIILIISAMLVYGLSGYIKICANASYIGCILSAFAAVLIYTPIYNHKALKGLLQSQGISGKIVCIVLATVFIVYSAAFASKLAWLVGKFFMPQSPLAYIAFFCILPGAFGGYFGMKSVSRYSVPLWIITLAATAFILFLCGGEYNTDNLYPIFGNGIFSIIKGSVNLTVFGALLLYYVIMSSAETTNSSVRKQITKFVLISGGFGAAVCLALNLVLPYMAVSYADNPYLTVASSVRANFMLERSEIVVLVLWIFCSFICSSAFCAGVFRVCKNMIGLQDKRGITGVVIALIYLIAIIALKLGVTDSLLAVSSYFLSLLSVIIPIIAIIRHFISGRLE